MGRTGASALCSHPGLLRTAPEPGTSGEAWLALPQPAQGLVMLSQGLGRRGGEGWPVALGCPALGLG